MNPMRVLKLYSYPVSSNGKCLAFPLGYHVCQAYSWVARYVSLSDVNEVIQILPPDLN